MTPATRPKRKAATNKSYTYDDPGLHDALLAAKPVKPLPPLTNGTTPGSSPRKRKGAVVPPAKPVMNWQPPEQPTDHFSNRLDLSGAYIDVDKQRLVCPQHEEPLPELPWIKPSKGSFTLDKGDYIYMVLEPPGEPYYIGRIMAFSPKLPHLKSEHGKRAPAKEFQFRIQWFYRPRDILKLTSDLRLLFALMHTDCCPLNSYRGKVVVKHKLEIEDSTKSQKGQANRALTPLAALDHYALFPLHFYFDKLFDRYMIKFYDVLATAQLLDVGKSEGLPLASYVEALHKRFAYVFCETLRTKLLLEVLLLALNNCEACGGFCDRNDDVVVCGECDKHFHMYCLDPPLVKKPLRGFSWTCAKCTRHQRLAHHAKRLLMLSADNKLLNEDDLVLELSALEPVPPQNELPLLLRLETPVDHVPVYEAKAREFLAQDSENSFNQRRLQEEWLMRYLGMHARLEDGVDVDDRNPYPRALTRLGGRHQASLVPECNDHPVVYYDRKTTAKPKKAGGRRKNKAEEEELKPLPVPEEYVDTPPSQYPEWLQPRPKGYIERGVDDGDGETCTLLWKSLELDLQDNFAAHDAYVGECAAVAKKLGLLENSPNFCDFVTRLWMECEGLLPKALKRVKAVTLTDLQEPQFTPEEVKRFEQGVTKYGLELYPVSKMLKSQPTSMVVRYYYLWKKTPNGRRIWGGFEGRRHKKLQNVVSEEKAAATANTTKNKGDELADPDDDLGYDEQKTVTCAMQCKHCGTNRLTKWFRVTGGGASTVEGSRKKGPVFGLCRRCARLWRRYAVMWEDPEEIELRLQKLSKRRVEPELAADLAAILAHGPETPDEIQSDLPLKSQSSQASKASSVEPVAKVKAVSKRSQRARSRKRAAPSPEPTELAEPEATPDPLPPPTPEPELDATPVKKEKMVTVKVKTESDAEPRHKAKRAKLPEVPLDITERNFLINPKYKEPLAEPNILRMIQEGNASAEDIAAGLAHWKITQKVLDTAHLNLLSLPEGVDIAIPSLAINTCQFCEIQAEPKELLICLLCRVSVHPLCAGLLMPDKLPKPVYEWICDGCTNDIKPFQLPHYTCCLCYKEDETKALLKPVIDSGRWCHVDCLVYASAKVMWRPPPPSLLSKRRPTRAELKKATNVTDSIAPVVVVDLVTLVLVANHDRKCSLCHKVNGTLVSCEFDGCDFCVHPTCAKGDSRFALGFVVDPTSPDTQGSVRVEPESSDSSDSTTPTKDDSTTPEAKPASAAVSIGKLRPALCCRDHGDKEVFSWRHKGRRSANSGPARPLIQLFWEDTSKLVTKLTGAQARLAQYIDNYLAFHKKSTGFDTAVGAGNTCTKCSTTISPIWFGTDEKVCLRCHHGVKAEELGDQLKKTLLQPLLGENYGIMDDNDRVTAPVPQQS